MQTIYLGLGSNLGDRAANIKKALILLAPEITVIKISPVYETKPMYLEEQPNFYNAVCEAKTDLSAFDVLKKIKSIEQNMGRKATLRNEPRPIDIDLLLHGEEIIDTPQLSIPHVGFRERDFVLRPLCDIAPAVRDPVMEKRIDELLLALPPSGVSIIGRVPDEL